MIFKSTEYYFFDVGDCCLEERICRTCDSHDMFSCFDSKVNLDCPVEDPCIPSNLYCVPEELGDGICQDHNNGPFCDFDLGDCCIKSEEKVYDECCQCSCTSVQSYEVIWFK